MTTATRNMNLTARLELESDDCLVEFGSFLGKSTASICYGLAKNTGVNNSTKIFAHDSFRCHSKGSFLPHLLKHCKQANVEHLLEITGDYFNFFPVFEYYLAEFIDSNLLIPRQLELIESFPSKSNIAFMHIDSPKMYSDFKPILFRFCPKLNKGSYIIFQDFFYHWSSSLIAIIWALVSRDIITPIQAASTSLVCEVKRRPNKNEIRDLDWAIPSGVFHGDAIWDVKVRFSKDVAKRAEKVQFHPSQKSAIAGMAHW